VVDDHADWRDVLATFLNLQGHNIRTAASGVEALVVCAEFAPEVVIICITIPHAWRA
jgi:CheY-like chemotaxis protein